MRIKVMPLTALAVGLALATPLFTLPAVAQEATAAQEATPAVTYSCEDLDAAASAGTPGAMAGAMAGMDTGTPMAEMEPMAMELDQMYIDMMIPHHAGIIGLAQAAQDRLTDERLQAIAQNIIAAQSTEIEELRGYREAFYGDAEPMPMDASMMAAMTEMMPGISGTREAMAVQMDPAAQAAAICAAENPDLAFIEMTMAHHQMAIESSEPVVAEATHEEIRAFAQRVIADQQREIDELAAIQAELTGEGTPAGA